MQVPTLDTKIRLIRECINDRTLSIQKFHLFIFSFLYKLYLGNSLHFVLSHLRLILGCCLVVFFDSSLDLFNHPSLKLVIEIYPFTHSF